MNAGSVRASSYYVQPASTHSEPGIPRTLLVLERDPSRRIELAAAFARRGFVTQIAAFGTRALAIAAWFEPAIVVIDMSVDDVSPIELVRLLQRSGQEPAPFAIGVLPAGSLPREATFSDFDAVLVRPANIERLVEAVATLAKGAHRDVAV